MFGRATLAVGLLCAAVTWTSQAGAASYTATFNIPDTGGAFGDVVNHFVSGPGATGGGTNTDTITVNLLGPGQLNSPGGAGAVALKVPASTGATVGFSVFSWQWVSDNLLTNISGTFDTSAQNDILLPFTATATPGDPYSSYHLVITSTTSGSNGGGYVYSLTAEPCDNCATTVVPVPPAAVLFMSALAGLGLLGRRRRKSAHDLTA